VSWPHHSCSGRSWHGPHKVRFEQPPRAKRPRSWSTSWRRGKCVRQCRRPIGCVSLAIRRCRRLRPAGVGRGQSGTALCAPSGAVFVLLAAVASALWRHQRCFHHASLGHRDVWPSIGIGLPDADPRRRPIALASSSGCRSALDRLRPWSATRVRPCLSSWSPLFRLTCLFFPMRRGHVREHLDPNSLAHPAEGVGTQCTSCSTSRRASAFPTDHARSVHVVPAAQRQWWRKVIIPGILPYYVTGALPASGLSWNGQHVPRSQLVYTSSGPRGPRFLYADARPRGTSRASSLAWSSSRVIRGRKSPGVAALLSPGRRRSDLDLRKVRPYIAACHSGRSRPRRQLYPKGSGENLLVLDDVTLASVHNEIVARRPRGCASPPFSHHLPASCRPASKVPIGGRTVRAGTLCPPWCSRPCRSFPG